MPLLNVPIPGEGYLFFETLAAIVEFDLIPVFDLWDAGFTQTEALTPGFQMLKFESLNFVESMGGVLIIGVLILLIYPMVAFFLIKSALIHKIKSQSKNFESLRLKQVVIGFMYGAAFDIIISTSLALYSFELLEVFNERDYISITFMFLFLINLAIFMVIIGRFSLFTTKKISTKEQAKVLQHFDELVSGIHDTFL